MQINRTLLKTALFAAALTLSCSGVQKQQEPQSSQTPVTSHEKERKTVTEEIVVKDIENGESYNLEKLSMGKPVFVEISASWCEPCREMEKITDKLYSYFKGKVFFIRLFMPKDRFDCESSPIFSMEAVSSPKELNIEQSEALPRVLILNRKGEIEADITGTYPMIYFYGILSEL
ncbi:MAG: TlpA family protein disulfide reductase [bacterium]